MFRFALLAAFLAASLSSAAEPVPITVFRISEPGYYMISGSQIVSFAPGGPVILPVDPVVDPVVPPVSTLTKTIASRIASIPATDKRHEVALKLSKTYQMLAGQTLPPAKVVEAVDKIVAMVLSASDVATWAGVSSEVTAALAKCTTESAVSAVLNEASVAVGASVPASGDDEKATAELYGIDWDAFMKFLMQLLTMLLPLIIKGI